jgi:hypothetical protein
VLGLCIHYDPHPQRREWWSYVAGWYGIEDIFEVGQPSDIWSLSRFLPQPVNSFAELPDSNLVVLQPEAGRLVQGQTSLHQYTHPEDAIYCFGYDHGVMEPFEREADFVYVPVAKYEMLAAFAATVTLEHRRWQWDQ